MKIKLPEASERIDQVSQIINQSLQDLRSLSKTLTDDNINQKGNCNFDSGRSG
jgi:signal transduction histidine kinase